MGFYNVMPDKNIPIDIIFKYIVDIAVAILFGVFVMHFMGIQTEVVGNSMSEELLNHDNVLINRFTYNLQSPNRYDVISFSKKNDEGEQVEYIKRIIGLPGDTIQIKEGRVYVNDKQIDYNAKKESIVNAGLAAEQIHLGEEEYFVMGDNWNSSEDSRSNSVGVVELDEINGKIWLIVSPFVRINPVK